MKRPDGSVVIVETKGREEIDLPMKMNRLRQWCEDINRVTGDAKFDYCYIDEESFKRFKPKSFHDVMKSFREYK